MNFKFITTFGLALFYLNAYTQTKITTVTTTPVTASSSYSYTNGGITYNWGLAPYNTMQQLEEFVAGGDNYAYAPNINGTLKMRRVNNAKISGNFTLVWSEVVATASVFNLLSKYENDMEPYFNNRIYNRGTDNLFDNTSTNCNNIERMDWIISSGYSTSYPDKVGFAVFERGVVGAHDPFCIAAITSVDGFGNPASYGNIVRVAATDYGDPGPDVNCRIVKAQYPNDLLDAATNTQSRGGVLISFQNLGITANQVIYGYSLFAADLPMGATPANLVDYTNATYFPTTTGNPGGIDLIAITGIYKEKSTLPLNIISFSATENQNGVQLLWKADNESSVDHYEIERSADGWNFTTISQQKKSANSSGPNSYTYTDIPTAQSSQTLFYRVKQVDMDGHYSYSKTLAIKRNTLSREVSIYPNPVSDHLYINISGKQNSIAILSVWNAAGVKVISQQLNLAAGNNSFSVNGIERLPEGIYQIHLRLPDGSVISKPILKQ